MPGTLNGRNILILHPSQPLRTVLTQVLQGERFGADVRSAGNREEAGRVFDEVGDTWADVIVFSSDVAGIGMVLTALHHMYAPTDKKLLRVMLSKDAGAEGDASAFQAHFIYCDGKSYASLATRIEEVAGLEVKTTSPDAPSVLP